MEVLPTANFQPDVLFWGVRVGEPVVALTSILVSLFCFYAWIRLGKVEQTGDALRFFRVFFLLTGLSCLVGGIVGHAFIYTFPPMLKLPGWVLSMIAVSALEQASIMRAQGFLGKKWKRVFTGLNIAELTVALWFVFATLWFPAVEIHSAFGFLLVIAPLEGWLFFKTRSPASRHILTGILLLVAAVAVHILKISAGVWFSYFDIAHLFMCAAIWAFMRGAEGLRLRSEFF
ncbi:MAG: hypothetical protein OHK0019_26370 [Saprospiraceae bacterium]